MVGFVRETVSKNHFKLLQDLYGEIWAGSVSCTGSICSIRIVMRQGEDGHILQGSGALSRDVRFQLLSL